ncbi:DEAD/DEAH box helicase [Psychrosphaera ytuae]|uniref:ATP-dependent RNA helicase RhlE n=1 Tax=Psychrosphaera ytuae TaxID=2820710 RepID=A0A975HIQ3_9GAMM|nr:DEAD/DEAH box helicase [Psychrosphaera ytuae]QTH64482.1 DEAD/DEAH box helicase [Psychrosphaera ytuae]
MQFTDLGLNEAILTSIAEQGYDSPSPIQAKAIPAVLSGSDVMAAAQTGTGKTAGFTLPMLERLLSGPSAKSNQVRALVLTPTRELAAQVADSVATYGKHLNLKSTVVFGGVKINPQMMALRKGVDILIATPGRLLDLYQQNAVKFEQLEMLVLDEADRMLDMGFIHDIKRILKLLPKKRQNLMFSATFSDDIKQLAQGLMNDPVHISVTPANTTTKLVEQRLYSVDQGRKGKLLIKLIKQNDWQQVLVFSRTKHGANRIARNLDAKNITAAAIHGNKSQGARTKALANFKNKEIRVLVATDIAARGLDIEQLPQVVNYDLPQVAEDYVHRIGRTGRAGAAGHAISLVSGDEFKNLNDIEQLIQQHIPRLIDEEFEPQMVLAESKPIKPPKKKKPKKNKKPKSEETEETSSSDTKSRASTTEGKDKTRQRRPNSNGSGANRRRKPDANKKTDSKPKPKNQGNNKPQNKTGQKPKQKSKYSINKAK